MRIINQYVKKEKEQTFLLTENINNNQILKLDNIECSEISCYFTKHRKIMYSNETVEFRITESKDKKIKILLKEILQIGQSNYINDINKAKQEEKEHYENDKRDILKNEIQKILKQKNSL